MNQDVGLFFCINTDFCFHACNLDKAEKYGDFLVYPKSHFDIWNKYYADKHNVDFDYFPRGRVAYRRSDGCFVIYYDRCIAKQVRLFGSKFSNVEYCVDEHYQCHLCNDNYVV